MRDASLSARAIIPGGPELNNLLIGVATEVANTVDTLLGDLDRRVETLHVGQAAPQLSIALLWSVAQLFVCAQASVSVGPVFGSRREVRNVMLHFH